jgi:tetratricopeptide (TPR) repeat protein
LLRDDDAGPRGRRRDGARRGLRRGGEEDVARAEQELAKERERKKKSASETRTTQKTPAVRATATNRPSEPEKSGDGKLSIQQDPKPQELLGNGNSGSETSHPREGSGIPNRAESPGSLSAAAGEAASSAAGVLSEARRLLKLGRKSEAEKILREALKAQPSRRELRLALLEVACLSRDWKTAAGQVSLVVPLKPGEVASMFYAAVVLYETGYPDRARPYMQRAKSWIQPSPYVDHYKEKILGRF